MSASVAEASDLDATDLHTESEVSRRVEEGVQAVGADVILGEIRKSCFIIYVTIRAWRGQYLMRNGQTTVDGKPVDEKLVTKGQWKLMPEKWHKALQPFESKIRKIVYTQGVQFKDGVYIVPKGRAKSVVDAIKSLRGEYMAKVQEFAEEWPAHVLALQDKFVAEHGEDVWRTISKLIPDARKLPTLFDVEVGLWPTGSGGFPIECFEDLERASFEIEAVEQMIEDLTGDDAVLLTSFVGHVRSLWNRVRRSGGKLIEENAEEWLDEAQSTTNRMVSAAVEAMISEPVKEFTEQIDKLLQYSENSRVRQATLDALQRAYQKLSGFSFMLPAELLERLRQVELRIGQADPQMMNSGSMAGSNLVGALRSIRDELDSDVNHMNTFGQFARNLDI